MTKPLEGLMVLEFCQYMAGPLAGLRLADLGARVIKIERPEIGEGGRGINIKNLFIGKDSLVFNTINRNKESYTANLKNTEDLELIQKLIARADVMTHNFRPGIMEKIGLDYDTVKKLNPQIVYGSVTGYGTEGPWIKKPGQDLLAQSMSGVLWLSGDEQDPPTPMGLAVADMLCGSHLVQGILAALVQKGKTGLGSRVEVSLLESMMDFQFEVITTHLNDNHKVPLRAKKGNAHAYLSAPYGIYQTKDSHIALAMIPLAKLANLISCERLKDYTHQESFTRRNEIMEILENIFIKEKTDYWLEILEKEDLWCAPVLKYRELLEHEAYKVLNMDQELVHSTGETVHTTRCPIRIDGERIFSSKAAPLCGEDTKKIKNEFLNAK